MGKWSLYGKRYNKDWEKQDGLKEWIRSVPGDESKAACKYCKSEIHAHHADLVDHAATAKHQRSAAPLSNSRNLFDVGIRKETIDNSIKSAELKLAMHIACHSSVLTVDHLGELMRDITGKDMALHLTKCTALITRVLGPSFHEELLADVNGGYSLIIDESTDIGLEKQLCIMVRYFSQTARKTVTTFLGLVSIEAGTAAGIFGAIDIFLKSKNIPITKCIGLATDGCNAMCGSNNSVITKFREKCPNIIHIKCICHSIQLC
jgi:hypothetical protein